MARLHEMGTSVTWPPLVRIHIPDRGPIYDIDDVPLGITRRMPPSAVPGSPDPEWFKRRRRDSLAAQAKAREDDERIRFQCEFTDEMVAEGMVSAQELIEKRRARYLRDHPLPIPPPPPPEPEREMHIHVSGPRPRRRLRLEIVGPCGGLEFQRIAGLITEAVGVDPGLIRADEFEIDGRVVRVHKVM